MGSFDRHPDDVEERLARHLHAEGLRPQACAAAALAECVPPVPAEQHPVVNLVLLPFDELEEASDPLEAFRAVHDNVEFPLRQLLERSVHAQLRLVRDPENFTKLVVPLRDGPGLDRSVPDRHPVVRHDEVHIDTHRPPEPLALRTCPERIIEREEAWIWLLIPDVVARAFEVLVEFERLPFLQECNHGVAVARPEGHLDRVGEPFVVAPGPADQAIHKHENIFFLDVGIDRSLTQIDESSLVENPEVPLFLEILQFFPHRCIGMVRKGKEHRELALSLAVAPRTQGLDHRLHRIAFDLISAFGAKGPPDAREEEPEVVVNLGRSPDGGARITRGGFLFDGDGGADPLDEIDVGLVHPF